MQVQANLKKIMAWAVVTAAMLCLAGCGGGGGGEALAQEGNRQVITFAINPGTFELISTNLPAIDLMEDSTRYTLAAGDNRLLFTTSEGIAQDIIAIHPNDVIIERPEAGTLTLILNQQIFFP